MTDNEMIELAAKAAGFRLIGWRIALEGPSRKWAEVMVEGNETPIKWNPLADDGDAQRLSVKLRLSVVFDTEFNNGLILHSVKASTPVDASGIVTTVLEPVARFLLNDMEATRRAIVRAAAEMQKAKEA